MNQLIDVGESLRDIPVLTEEERLRVFGELGVLSYSEQNWVDYLAAERISPVTAVAWALLYPSAWHAYKMDRKFSNDALGTVRTVKNVAHTVIKGTTDLSSYDFVKRANGFEDGIPAEMNPTGRLEWAS